jgi:predicted RNA-binding Zn ribbon-like protein
MAALWQARVDGESIPVDALARLGETCRSAERTRALPPSGPGAPWTWSDSRADPRRPAHAVALEAARLVTTEDLERVRQCGDAECGWFFLDTSRNRTRRWCSMEACGNRNKARRFYRREASRARRRR